PQKLGALTTLKGRMKDFKSIQHCSYLDTRIGDYSGYFLVGISFVLGLFACLPQVADEWPVPNMSKVEKLVAERYDTVQVDTMVSNLMEVVMAPPAERAFAKWYHLRQGWEAVYGDRENLLLLCKLAYERNLARGELKAAARIQGAIGKVYALDGEYPKALEAQNLALDNALQLGDSSLLALALSGVGSAIASSNDTTLSAATYFNRSLAIAKTIGALDLQSIALYGLAGTYSDRFQVDTALHFVEAAYEAAKLGGYEQLEIPAHLRAASYLTYKRRLTKAIYILEEVLRRKPAPGKLDLAFTHLLLYYAYNIGEAVPKADAELDIACAMMAELQYGYGEKLCAIERAKQAAARKDFEDAYNKHQAFFEIYAAQEGVEARRAVRSFEVELQLREKDLEIEQLNRVQREKDDAYRRRVLFMVLGGLCLVVIGLSAYLLSQAKLKTQLSEEQRATAETKLQLLQSQMNPHFVFIAINGVQNAILRDHKMEAYNYLNKFSSLLRTSARFSTDLHISISQELTFLRNYLALEKMRFGAGFEFSLTVEGALEESQQNIPAMIIQPFIENALVHGLAGIDYTGQLMVRFSAYGNDGIRCVVVDNGRGRAAAEKMKNEHPSENHLSIATHNSAERLAYLREQGYTSTRIEITDLVEHNAATGTQVEIYLPFLSEEVLL
ncbi:MAG: histidine kinase, partial [Bacteroidota bacterium]